jgi:copper type II ascorbate-dependent monooxygenase-like protein
MRIALAIALTVLTAAAADARPYLRKPQRGFQVRAGAFTVHPGQDLEMCEYRRLPNRKAVDITGFQLRMPAGAHHFVVWAYGGDVQDDSQFPAEPVESVACAGVSPDEPIPQVLIPIQTPNARFKFPPGIALRLAPHQQVWLNPHLKNFGDAPMNPDIRFNFYKAKKGTVRHYAEGMIVGNAAGIHIPAGGEQTLTAEWTSPIDLTVIQMASHQHRLGTYANIELVNRDGSLNRIYENTDWEHPASFWPDPPIQLARGDKMRITCTWHNTDDHDVFFGPETTDEMCFILGFYYRNDGGTGPVTGTGCLPAKSGLLCANAPTVP